MKLTPPKAHVPIGRMNAANEILAHPEWLRYLAEGVFNRAGGTEALSNAELQTVVVRVERVLGSFSGSIQAAIDAANAAGGGIVRPEPGVWTLTQQLRLKSGVTLDLSGGVTLKRGFNTSSLGAGLIGIEAGSNIKIVGGTLDGNGQNYTTSFDMVYASGVSNLTIEGVKFLSVVDFHAIDLEHCHSVKINKCRFLGFWNKAGNRGYSEAVQLDPGIASGGTINTDVSVTDCTFAGPEDSSLVDFGPWPCAMGNHSGYDSKYHKDIRFVGNTVSGAYWAGVNLLNMAVVAATGNTFTDCLHGVRLRLKDDVSPAQACSDVTITGNTFKGISEASIKFASPTSGNVSNIGTGRHTGITISGNSSRAEYALVQGCWGSRVSISGNAHNGGNYGVDVRFCDAVSVADNVIEDVEQSGVWVNESTETTKAGLGLTADISITGNVFRRCGYRGVHVNCDARRVKISTNQVLDPSTSDPSREGIRVDTGGDQIAIIGNMVDGSDQTYGISVSGAPTNVTIKGNKANGSIAPYQSQAVGAILDIEGDGTPEGIVSAGIGSRYLRLDGGAGSTLYIKESGTGNTGWAVYNGSVTSVFACSTAAQGPGFASDTYLAGSAVAVTRLMAGTTYRLTLDVSKTAAETAAPVVSIRYGTTGTTADTAITTLTFAAQTAAADDGVIEIWLTFRAVGASAVVQAVGRLSHKLASTGLSVDSCSTVRGTSGTFDSTVASSILGVSVNAGASAAWTVQLAQAELTNLS